MSEIKTKSCYRFDSISYKVGILDNIIDAVYVLLLENSIREKSVYSQLKSIPLSKNIHIQINKGFRRCEKNLTVNNTIYDVTHALFNVFKNAEKKKYKNILVLEDDFVFDNRIQNKNTILNLERFINNEPFDIYYLGCVPVLFSSNIRYLRHLKLRSSRCIHSTIFTPNSRKKIITAYSNSTKYNSRFLEITFPEICNNIYCYYKPLVYQTFPETEQSKTWLTNGFIKYFIKKNNLESKPQPGFNNIYIIIYTIHILILLIIITLLSLLCYFMSKKY